MNGRGTPGDHRFSGSYAGHGDYSANQIDAATDWFAPVTATQTVVGVLDRPEPRDYPAYPPTDHPSFPSGDLRITPEDVLEVLGPDAEDLLATAEIDVDEVIRLINAETTVLPPLVIPDTVEELEGAEGPAPGVVEEAITTWKQRFLKGAVTAVLLSLTGAGGAAAAMDKSVTVEVDGHEQTVHTFKGTVGEVLESKGIKVGSHDALSPSPQSKISDGGVITLDRGRQLALTVDGEKRQEWVRSVTVGQALRQLGVATDGAWISADVNTPVPDQGMDLVVKTQKTVTLIDGTTEPRQVTTHAVTVNELLGEQKLNVGASDEVIPGADQKLGNGVEIRIVRNGSTVINLTMPIDPPVQEIVDPTMFKGEEQVVDPGAPGEKIAFTRVTTRNGKEVERVEVGSTVTKQPKPKVVRVGGKEPPDSAVWDKLAHCEATGNWSVNSGNGYYGGLQFDKQTWDAFGGDQYAPYPHQASREQQIAIATKVRDSRGGYGAWPACSAKLGLS